MQEQPVITRTIRAARGVLAPGHLGELTQTIDFGLALLPGGLALARPAASLLCRVRRRIGPGPLRRLFETLAGPVGLSGQPGAFYRGLRTVAVDGTHLHVPDAPAITWRYPRARWRAAGVRLPAAAAGGPGGVRHPRRAGRRVRHRHRRRAGLRRRAAGRAGRDDAAAGPDAGFDAAEFVRDVTAAGAQFLVRSAARRCPTPLRHLPDGSYLARIGYGVLPALLAVRVIGLDQETWALLAAYQALIRPAADTAATRPGLDTDRISFTIVLQTATRLVTTATGILPHGPPDLAGQIGRAALADLLPARRRPRPNHAPARTPPPSTAAPPHSQPPARPTPSPPASPSSKKNLRPAHDAKRNGVDGNVEVATSSARTRISPSWPCLPGV